MITRSMALFKIEYVTEKKIVPKNTMSFCFSWKFKTTEMASFCVRVYSYKWGMQEL